MRSAPSLTALRQRVEAARERSRAAGALPDPMISFGLSGERIPGRLLGTDPMAMGTVMGSQAVPFPGKRGLRRAAAEAEVGVRRAEWARLRRGLAAETRSIYADLFALDAMVSALLESTASLHLLEAGAASRSAVGLAAQTDLIEVQLERSRLAEQRNDIAGERASLVAGLNALLDRAPETPVRTDSLPEAGLDPAAHPAPTVSENEAFDSLAAARAPQVETSRREMEVARLRLAAARRESWPDVAGGIEYGWRDRLPPVVTATLGVELPLWKGGKQDAETRAARHQLEAARYDLRTAEAEARGEAARLRSAQQAAARQVELYRREILPRSVLLLDSSRSSYAAGISGGIDDMVTALRRVSEARAGLARREAELYKAEVAIAALAGVDPLVPQEVEP